MYIGPARWVPFRNLMAHCHLCHALARSAARTLLHVCAEQDSENLRGSHRQQHNSASGNDGTAQQGLNDVLQPLLKAACSARGKRSCQDAPGVVLAAAVRALRPAGHDSADAQAACVSVTAQMATMLAQGTLSIDVAGSFQALQAGWEQQSWCGMSSAKVARNSLHAIAKALSGKCHWTVRRLLATSWLC